MFIIIKLKIAENHLHMPARFSDIITMTFKLQIDDKPDYDGMSVIMEKIIKDERVSDIHYLLHSEK